MMEDFCENSSIGLLHKICETTGFHWLVFSYITTESYVLLLYGRIQVSESPYSPKFYAVLCSVNDISWLNMPYIST